MYRDAPRCPWRIPSPTHWTKGVQGSPVRCPTSHLDPQRVMWVENPRDLQTPDVHPGPKVPLMAKHPASPRPQRTRPSPARPAIPLCFSRQWISDFCANHAQPRYSPAPFLTICPVNSLNIFPVTWGQEIRPLQLNNIICFASFIQGTQVHFIH